MIDRLEMGKNITGGGCGKCLSKIAISSAFERINSNGFLLTFPVKGVISGRSLLDCLKCFDHYGFSCIGAIFNRVGR